ncbi:aromatic prenyltransferase [Nocardia sp. NPDC049149]|uniref:aromatic prenyltransferase n=1 Tax=Nocardia sp. NPDC049149 TaxID=3364315 RepID=UPI003712C8A7
MSTPVDLTLDQLRHDLRELAGLAEVRYDPTVVDPVLEVLDELWASSWIGTRTTTQPANRREVSARLMSSDESARPVAALRDAGLLEFTGHPMERLLAEVTAAVPVRWGVDLSVVRGVQKIWLVFPELVSVDRMLSFPGIPDAARDHAGHLNRYGGEIGIMALDFLSHTMNWYSQVFAPGTLTAADITVILAELDFVPASEEELSLLAKTFNVYRTFSWDSPRMHRIAFPVRTDAAHFPVHLDPVLDRFVGGAPFVDTGEHGFVFYTAYGPNDRYYKVQADYRSAARATFPGGTAPQIT